MDPNQSEESTMTLSEDNVETEIDIDDFYIIDREDENSEPETFGSITPESIHDNYEQVDNDDFFNEIDIEDDEDNYEENIIETDDSSLDQSEPVIIENTFDYVISNFICDIAKDCIDRLTPINGMIESLKSSLLELKANQYLLGLKTCDYPNADVYDKIQDIISLHKKIDYITKINHDSLSMIPKFINQMVHNDTHNDDNNDNNDTHNDDDNDDNNASDDYESTTESEITDNQMDNEIDGSKTEDKINPNLTSKQVTLLEDICINAVEILKSEKEVEQIEIRICKIINPHNQQTNNNENDKTYINNHEIDQNSDDQNDDQDDEYDNDEDQTNISFWSIISPFIQLACIIITMMTLVLIVSNVCDYLVLLKENTTLNNNMMKFMLKSQIK